MSNEATPQTDEKRHLPSASLPAAPRGAAGARAGIRSFRFAVITKLALFVKNFALQGIQ
jgi:hypothetical protein